MNDFDEKNNIKSWATVKTKRRVIAASIPNAFFAKQNHCNKITTTVARLKKYELSNNSMYYFFSLHFSFKLSIKTLMTR